MAPVAAMRESLNSYKSSLSYYVSDRIDHESTCITLNESTHMVDGIGGGVWEGAIVLSNLMEAIVSAEHHVLELGCGAGLTGIVSALHGAKVTLTDRTADLAEENISLLRQHLMTSTRQNAIESLDITSYELSWDENDLEGTILHKRGPVDIIIGAEITCLRKQQQKLTRTIDSMSGPETIVLLSFDDPAMDICSNAVTGAGAISKYEREMDEKMKSCGFNRAVVCTATVEWHKQLRQPTATATATATSTSSTGDLDSQTANIDYLKISISADERANEAEENVANIGLKKSFAVVHDVTTQHYNNCDKISFPPLIHPTNYGLNLVNDCSSSSRRGYETIDPTSSCTSSHTHHITAYYRHTATPICCQCDQLYFTVLNGPNCSMKLCRHHTGRFIAEIKEPLECIDGSRTEYWDCCGVKGREAVGCTLSRHLIREDINIVS